MITIVDYGSGNIAALTNIYKQLNISYCLASTPQEVHTATKLILPGVGAFDRTMDLLNDTGLTVALNEQVLVKKIPILGICVGMQVMARGSDEGQNKGLGWIDAYVKRFDASMFKSVPHLPHMGWNTAKPVQEKSLLFNINQPNGFYFLHSYYFACNKAENIMAETFYGITYASAVVAENIFGVQFHPEKSHANGVQVLTNFAEL